MFIHSKFTTHQLKKIHLQADFSTLSFLKNFKDRFTTHFKHWGEEDLEARDLKSCRHRQDFQKLV